MSLADSPVAVVLGATGWVGRHICAAFAASGTTVIGVARSTHGHGGVVAFDVVNSTPDRFADLLADADVVVNAAGAVWGADEQQMRAANVELVHRLVAAVSALPRPPRLLHLGSAYEYGLTPHGRSAAEDMPCAPTTVYGQSKLLATQYVLRATEDGGLDGIVLRLANVAGPGAPAVSLPGMVARHLADAARRLARGLAVPELKLVPLTQRDYVDVRDVADAVVTAAGLGVVGQAVNIGSGTAVSVRDLVDRMIAVSGIAVPVAEDVASGSHRGSTGWVQLDIGAAHRLLGWQPRRGLDTSLRDLLADWLVPSLAP